MERDAGIWSFLFLSFEAFFLNNESNFSKKNTETYRVTLASTKVLFVKEAKVNLFMLIYTMLEIKAFILKSKHFIIGLFSTAILYRKVLD